MLASSEPREIYCPFGSVGGLMETMLSIGKLAAGQAGYYLEQAHGTVTRAGVSSMASGMRVNCAALGA